MSLPTDRDARNALPVWEGCIAYFPDCWAEIAKVSVLGNKQHALGDKLRFARDVSTDHANKVMRALAALQVAIEAKQPAEAASGLTGGPALILKLESGDPDQVGEANANRQ
jgi:hypothetical protein